METPLEQAERHLREGAERIVKQRSLIEQLRRDGQVEVLATAKGLLSEMLKFQEAGRNHLATERERPNEDTTDGVAATTYG